MKVYAIFDWYDTAEEKVIAVFSTFELAKAFLDMHQGECLGVKELILDEVPTSW